MILEELSWSSWNDGITHSSLLKFPFKYSVSLSDSAFREKESRGFESEILVSFNVDSSRVISMFSSISVWLSGNETKGRMFRNCLYFPSFFPGAKQECFQILLIIIFTVVLELLGSSLIPNFQNPILFHLRSISLLLAPFFLHIELLVFGYFDSLFGFWEIWGRIGNIESCLSRWLISWWWKSLIIAFCVFTTMWYWSELPWLWFYTVFLHSRRHGKRKIALLGIGHCLSKASWKLETLLWKVKVQCFFLWFEISHNLIQFY